MTYLLISIPFLSAALIGALALTPWRDPHLARRQWAATGIAIVVLAILTAVFDSLMIAADLFSYGHGHTLGPTVGLMPVEDFSYPVAAALLAPALWTRLTARRPSADAPNLREDAPDARA
ncbi:lycopene cyclase domain-containing protein [Leucobacter chromiiresistens]|uniref:Lycopene cyclase domain-containing protein n=1 Tax=Leucobacter chromiiresistens TaxID=1079994 RepID=A0A1H0YKX5_9MICO|nr:lycopene cyclase domain-containing protein [Leucobacter chromiiresistens]SDQ15857.1 lycopene cyclase domain-containing protein [Leucobacter chromiiresistens]